MSQKSVQSKPSQDPTITKWEAENRTQLQQTLASYATEYKEKEAVYIQANAKSAESVLALCKIVAEANLEFVQLPDYLFQFRLKTNLRNKSTFSQHVTIGMNHERLMAHVQQLPCSWYTLYQIARLKDETFAKAVAAKKIHPKMTQREVEVLAGRAKKSSTRTLLCQIEVSNTTSLTKDEAKAFAFALMNFLKSQPAPLNTGLSVAWSRGLKAVTKRAATTPPPPQELPKDFEAFFDAEARKLVA